MLKKFSQPQLTATVSRQNSFIPYLVSKTTFQSLNECLHGIYGYGDELVCLERIDCDVEYLVSIQDRFDEDDAFLIGIWIDKLKRALRAPLQK